LPPHDVQRVRWRKRSLDVPAPHRMTATAQAIMELIAAIRRESVVVHVPRITGDMAVGD